MTQTPMHDGFYALAAHENQRFHCVWYGAFRFLPFRNTISVEALTEIRGRRSMPCNTKYLRCIWAASAW
jgi:hypothetical protein